MSIIDKFLDVMRLNDDDYEFDNEDYDTMKKRIMR